MQQQQQQSRPCKSTHNGSSSADSHILHTAATAAAVLSTNTLAPCCPSPPSQRRQQSYQPTLPHPPPLQVSITFKNQQVLQNCSWEVKKGERVGLVGELTKGIPVWGGGAHTGGLAQGNWVACGAPGLSLGNTSAAADRLTD